MSPALLQTPLAPVAVDLVAKVTIIVESEGHPTQVYEIPRVSNMEVIEEDKPYTYAKSGFLLPDAITQVIDFRLTAHKDKENGQYASMMVFNTA